MPAPPKSALKAISEIAPQLLSEVREKFLAEAKSNPDLYNGEDVECVESNEWQVQRFILEHKHNGEQALKALITAMRWRKLFGVKDLNETKFPKEYYKSGSMITYGKDRNNATVLIIRANIHKKINEWSDIIKKYFIFQVERIDHYNDGKGVTLIFDCTGIGFGNLDLDLLQFVVTSFSNYYPKLFDAIIVHELPFLLQYVFKLVQSWLPEDDRKYFHLTNKKNLNDFVYEEELPKFLGGKNPLPYQIVPKNVLAAEDLVAKIGLKKKDADKLKYLDNYMK